MEIKQTLILETSDSLSKALSQLDESPAVIVTKKGRYYGIIDHHSLRRSMKEPHNTKCETMVVRPPVLFETAHIFDRMDAFLTGHFKALPVINKEHKPIGITTRVELLKEMIKYRMIPALSVSEMMSSPVYTIDNGETVGIAKRAIKDKKARRLVVTNKGNLLGVVSTYDLSVWASMPNAYSSGRRDIKTTQTNIDVIKISEFFRPDVALVQEGSTVERTVKKMIEKQVSTVIVVAEGKPVGIISALDIFKKVHDMTNEDIIINVSGLSENEMHQYDYIINKVGHVLEKFRKVFNIRNCNVHIKKGKSAFNMNLNFDTDSGHLSIKGEAEFLRDCIDEVAGEVATVLRKKREKTKNITKEGK
ncbi:MAG: CBS domain-containing protein [Candidatus Micrarchaeota archaeon]